MEKDNGVGSEQDITEKLFANIDNRVEDSKKQQQEMQSHIVEEEEKKNNKEGKSIKSKFFLHLIIALLIMLVGSVWAVNTRASADTINIIVAISIGYIFVNLIIFLVDRSSSVAENIEKRGYDSKQAIYFGGYLVGHIDINEEHKQVQGFINDSSIGFFALDDQWKEDTFLGDIPLNAIENVVVENATQGQKRPTLGRFLGASLIGGVIVGAVASLLFQKRDSIAFLVIEWNKGKFKNETVFVFDGAAAFTLANTARNTIIKRIM